ncbi:MAG TPA: hypothetical protein VFS94_06155 [Gemmatimonadales bacterium]|nr:hypothetical protein [Gemmatimonadales bacterium]
MAAPLQRLTQLHGAKRVALVLVAALLACGTRDRLVFEQNVEPGEGPITFIDHPEAGEVRVDVGPDVVLAGRSIDPDGVDSVYFVIVGASLAFSPFSPATPDDTVSFGIPIRTIGSGGDSILVLVFATDAMGNRGDTAVRRLIVE